MHRVKFPAWRASEMSQFRCTARTRSYVGGMVCCTTASAGKPRRCRGQREKLVKHLDRQMAGLARAKATLQGRPLAEVCRELGTQTLVDNVRDPKRAERMRKLEARYRFLDAGEREDAIDGLSARALCAPPYDG